MRKVCLFTLLVLLNVFVKAQVVPGFSVIAQNSVACTNVPLEFSASTHGGNAVFSWSVSPERYAVINPASSGASVSVNFTRDLTYTVYVTAAESGSTQTIKKIIIAYRTAKAAFNASLSTNGYPAEMLLTNYSTGYIKNYWLYSDQQEKDSTASTVKQYSKSGSYTITLIAFGQKGCNDISAYAFSISDSSSVKLPNIFTPNGDEINDIYKPMCTGLVEMHAFIFNREGVMMHSWDKINGFWDGRTTSGEACPDGVYFIVLDAKGFDGQSYKMSGNITLIR